MKKIVKKGIVLFICIMMVFALSGCSAPNNNNISLENQVIDVEDIENARQLGGYVAADGRKVKDGLLLRTGGISNISDQTAEKLAKEYNVKYVIDLRMDFERKNSPDKEIEGAQNIGLSLYNTDMSDPDVVELMKKIQAAAGDDIQQGIYCSEAGTYKTQYSKILQSEQGQKGLKQFFEILLENGGEGAVLWHCTYGKDRTGVAGALILYALGVDEDTIMQDFLLTNEANADKIKSIEAELIERGCEESVVKDALSMGGVDGDYFKAAFDEVKGAYGSVIGYINQKVGISNEQIEQLKDMYLE
ncbi:MAG: tyrosine-protein phosphatase [Candidatus Coproplasma sp.]